MWLFGSGGAGSAASASGAGAAKAGAIAPGTTAVTASGAGAANAGATAATSAAKPSMWSQMGDKFSEMGQQKLGLAEGGSTGTGGGGYGDLAGRGMPLINIDYGQGLSPAPMPVQDMIPEVDFESLLRAILSR